MTVEVECGQTFFQTGEGTGATLEAAVNVAHQDAATRAIPVCPSECPRVLVAQDEDARCEVLYDGTFKCLVIDRFRCPPAD